ncbi:MAG: cation transporter, partial [Nitrospinae bacterium]|nr:cation transporter [Nitrospinota bacterium]
MRTSSPDADRSHAHVFDEGDRAAERNTRRAVLLTVIMMAVEIVGGWTFNSMALLADGWHMSSHALALGLSATAYSFARRYAHDERFSFGAWKIEVLAGYTSALFLTCIAALMLYHSVERLIAPAPIRYDQAIVIAAAGLAVNLACAWLLSGGHSRHDDPHGHFHHHDLNLRSAYLHVVADAATSVFALLALTGGKWFGADRQTGYLIIAHGALAQEF